MEGCQGWATIRTNFRIHFVHRHVRDTVVILGEGNRPHLRCDRCNMFVPRAALNASHPGTEMCARGVERKRLRLAAKVARASAETVFRAYGQPLANVGSFKYLGHLLLATDDDWPAVVVNLRKARNKWARMPWIMRREGADARTPRTFFKAVIQTALLFG